jgi:hypothetical protein
VEDRVQVRVHQRWVGDGNAKAAMVREARIAHSLLAGVSSRTAGK